MLALTVAACGGSGNKKSSGGGGGTKTSASSNNPLNGAKIDKALGTAIFGTLPPSGAGKKGGTITLGQITGATPTDLFPILPSADTTTAGITTEAQLYMPLFAGPTGAEPKVNYAQSAASGPPVPSNGDKTFTIHLKPGLKWSDGKPLDANDVLFWYYLLHAAIKESAANWGQYVAGQFPMDVTSASAPNSTTVVFNLNTKYNPGYFLNNQLADTDNVYPLPSQDWNIDSTGGSHLSNWKNPAVAKKIYDYLNKQGTKVAAFGTNPLWKVVSGPFKLKSFNTVNSSYVLTPNPNYGGTPKSSVNAIDVNTYTSFTSELNAMQGGSLDVMIGFDPSQLGQVSSLKSKGIDVYGGPGWGWFGGIINFQDHTDDFNNVIKQLYVRQAIDYMIDQPGIIKGVYKGAAVTAYGPTPSAPLSPYAAPDAATAPYPYSPSKGVALLKSHGWKVVPNGQTTCAKPGTGAGECGAGIPKGTPIKFVWANPPSSFSSTAPLESEALSSVAKQDAGINISFVTKTFNFLVSEYTNTVPAGLKNHNAWGVNNYGGLYQDYYPTQAGVLNNAGTLTTPSGGFNTGAYNDPHGDALINASVHGGNPAAVKTEASYFEHQLPIFYFPAEDYLLAVNTKKVTGPAMGWTVMTQQQPEPQYWSVK
jgi:peptide/nickel transport system substrate-binding protein